MRMLKKVAAIVLTTLATTGAVHAASAGLLLPFGEYSVFVRSNGVTEIRVNGNITDRTNVTLDCVTGSGRDILAVGNQVDPGGSTPNYNDATLATVLTAYATGSAIEVLISDTDRDSNNNCGVVLVHLRCEGCPSGL